MVKFVVEKPLEVTADWFDKKSDDVIEVGDGKPGFEFELDTTEIKKILQEERDARQHIRR